MKLTANREALHHGFQRVGGVVSSTIQQPVYRNVKMQAVGDAVYLTATDLEVGLKLRVPNVRIDEEGVALVPPGRVSPILGATPDEEITIEEKDGTVNIETSDSHFRILGEDPADFPELPAMPKHGLRNRPGEGTLCAERCALCSRQGRDSGVGGGRRGAACPREEEGRESRRRPGTVHSDVAWD